MAVKNSLKIHAFKTAKDWKKWLEKNHAKSMGIWLRFFKKGSGVPSVTYAEALDEALCFGWIDSQLQKYDEISYLQKFTPRRSKSLWSKRNIEHVGRLVKEGRMQPAGKRAMEAAQTDGRWELAYDSSGTMEVPTDFLKALSKNKKARATFAKLNRANTYAIAWRLQTAKKPQTRARRMKTLLDMLAQGKMLH
ncbi:MAG: YdeI/OmpD-associated family protein [candidate division Zixibacteria bacterium]|nr:YdeI/OmpD-associated family protein [candidate division Zixibacteria bacterium]MCI0597354.1 YdeI/OmpD-associated family protein [candidate division Zixibacteria bacterium]